VLRVGGSSRELAIPTGYFGGVGISVIDIDAADRRKEILIQRRGESEEDPWYEFTVAIYDGGLHVQELWHSGGYNSGEVVLDGRGTLTLYYDECPDSTMVEYRLRGAGLVESGRKTVRTHDPDRCAACPHVYALEGDAFVYRGEILRNLSSPELETKQALRLSRAAIGGERVVTIELREEKDETTFLEEIYLEIDGVAIEPRECAAGGGFCRSDGSYHVIERGDSLRLTFAVDAASGTPRLVAVGYYVPR
jgi:hypothetical protein